MMTRLSGSGVEPLTILVAQNICSMLPLSDDGQQKVAEALTSLKSFGPFGDALWFGFGVRHIVRSLSTTREGLGCIALCSALGETHSAEISAFTLSRFADLTGVQRELSPSIAQWKRLVQTCSGSLIKSNFADVVRETTQPGLSQPGTESYYRVPEAADPQDLATALAELSKVISRRLDSVTFTGGADCRWLGAVAYWLWGLSVSVEVRGGPATIYRGSVECRLEKPHVRIVYENAVGSPSETSSLVIQKSHRLGYISELINRQLPEGATLFTIRVPWKSALVDTFGRRPLVNLVEKLPIPFVTAIGSAASLFESVARATNDVKPASLCNDNTEFLEGTYGRGFLHVVWKRFPELPQHLQSLALDLLESRFSEARASYESAVLQLSNACECGTHTQGEDSGICIVAFLETIIYIGRATPSIIIDDSMLPSSSSIFGIYNSKISKTRRHLKDPSHHFFALMRTGTSETWRPLKKAHMIFGGSSLPSLGGEFAMKFAITDRGLCFYLDSLCSLSDAPELLSRVHVVPGRIQLDNRTCFEVQDAPFEPPRYNARKQSSKTTLTDHGIEIRDDLKAEAIATEAEKFVLFSWKISNLRGDSSWIPPAKLAYYSAEYQGRVSYNSIDCAEIGTIPALHTVIGEGKHVAPNDHSAKTVRFVPRTGPVWAVCLLEEAGIRYNGKRNDRIILQTRECLNCCVKALLKLDGGTLIARI